jgi:hypothetical protein
MDGNRQSFANRHFKRGLHALVKYPVKAAAPPLFYPLTYHIP